MLPRKCLAEGNTQAIFLTVWFLGFLKSTITLATAQTLRRDYMRRQQLRLLARSNCGRVVTIVGWMLRFKPVSNGVAGKL